MSKSQKFRNVARNPKVAFVVDDITSRDPWRVRCLEIRGTAEQAHARDERAAGVDERGRGRRRTRHRDHPDHAAPGHQPSASTTRTPNRISWGRTRATSDAGPRAARAARPPPPPRCRQVRQHRRGQAARPFVSARRTPSPPTPVTSTVPTHGLPGRLASGTCDNPKRPPAEQPAPPAPKASRRDGAQRGPEAASSDHTVPNGMRTSSQPTVDSGSSRSAMSARTRGIGSPRRRRGHHRRRGRPAHRSPPTVLAAAARAVPGQRRAAAVPNAACGIGCHRAGIRGASNRAPADQRRRERGTGRIFLARTSIQARRPPRSLAGDPDALGVGRRPALGRGHGRPAVEHESP